MRLQIRENNPRSISDAGTRRAPAPARKDTAAPVPAAPVPPAAEPELVGEPLPPLPVLLPVDPLDAGESPLDQRVSLVISTIKRRKK
jgi:hypothetical protein